MKRILCVATTGMGNVLLYLPVIRTLRARYPDAVIDLLVSNAPAQQLLQGMPEINNIIYFNKRSWSLAATRDLLSSLRRAKYDLFITSYLDKSFKVALLGWVLNIPVRVGFDKGIWGILHTHRVRETRRKHEVAYNLDLLRAIGLTDISTSLVLPVSQADAAAAATRLPYVPGRRQIGFHPGSGTDLGVSVKRWGVERFALLADMLAERTQSDILIFGGPEERPLADAMASAMRHTPRIMVGESITSSAALIARCDLFVSNDSGLMHLAAAVRVPVVGIFGPTLYWKNFPWEVPHAIVRSHLHCAPCYRLSGISCNDQQCLTGITVEEVFSQALILLEKCVRDPVRGHVLRQAVTHGTNAPRAAQAKRVTIITPDFSHNCIGRAFMLAELLCSRDAVEIVGPAFEGRVWAPIEHPPEGVTYTYSLCSKARFFCSTAFRLARMIDGDVIIISKPVLPSMFLALLTLLRRRAPLIMDIDDWEIGFELDRFNNGGFFHKMASIGHILKLAVCEALARCIHARIVSNTYLQRSFGGLLIPHVRDTRVFDPSAHDRDQLRRAYGIPQEKRVILFLGTPREHKGLVELTSAFKMINVPHALLLLVGFNFLEGNQRELHDRIKEQLGDTCLLFGQQPFDRIPGFLSMADVVVIPQKNTPSSKGQIPAKLFDAMAMGKPIIASKVNDIPEILKACGLTYTAGNVDELAGALETVLGDQQRATAMGAKARELCVSNYSYTAVREEVLALVDTVGGPAAEDPRRTAGAL